MALAEVVDKSESSTPNDLDKISEDATKDQGLANTDHVKVEGATEGLPNLTPDQEAQDAEAAEPYSSFGPWDKKLIVLAATLAAFFSPLNAQIYFPAFNSLAKDFRVSNSKINLTVTTYMILQATAPAFTGAFSDTAGRRPAYIICFVIYIAANIALALQNNYTALLILRMVQSAGSSGTVALANAVVADVATSAERGIYIGITSLTGILAPSLGPVLGGILSQYAGWKWIFWFLVIFATAVFIPLLLFFPETCRAIVGNGTIPPPKWNRCLLNSIKEKKLLKAGITPNYAERDALAKNRRIRFPNPLATLMLLLDREGACILTLGGVTVGGFFAIIAGMPSQLHEIYGLDDLRVGFMYLPISGGGLVSGFTTGKIIDWSYRREAKQLGITVIKSRQQDLSKFPIEKARLQVAVPFLLFSAAATIGYGWILDFHTHIAGPCVMLFLLGYQLMALIQVVSILIVEINRESAGTATAAFNLVRCSLGAVGSAVIIPLQKAMGLGWSYTLIGFVYILLSPLVYVAIRWGPQWRAERDAKWKGLETERDEVRKAVELEKAA